MLPGGATILISHFEGLFDLTSLSAWCVRGKLWGSYSNARTKEEKRLTRGAKIKFIELELEGGQVIGHWERR